MKNIYLLIDKEGAKDFAKHDLWGTEIGIFNGKSTARSLLRQPTRATWNIS